MGKEVGDVTYLEVRLDSFRWPPAGWSLEDVMMVTASEIERGAHLRRGGLGLANTHAGGTIVQTGVLYCASVPKDGMLHTNLADGRDLQH